MGYTRAPSAVERQIPKKTPKWRPTVFPTVCLHQRVNEYWSWRVGFQGNPPAEPSATVNEHAYRGLHSEPYTPRQRRSSLSIKVRKNEKRPVHHLTKL